MQPVSSPGHKVIRRYLAATNLKSTAVVCREQLTLILSSLHSPTSAMNMIAVMGNAERLEPTVMRSFLEKCTSIVICGEKILWIFFVIVKGLPAGVTALGCSFYLAA